MAGVYGDVVYAATKTFVLVSLLTIRYMKVLLQVGQKR